MGILENGSGRLPEVTQTPAWYALRVVNNHDKQVVKALCMKGLEAFSPQRFVRRQWVDRVRTIQMPIFPGYVFCRFSAREQVLVLRTSGLLPIKSHELGLIVVPETEVAELQKLAQARVDAQPIDYVESGNLKVIQTGPLSGLQLFVREHNGATEFVKSFHSFRQSCLIISS